MARKRKARRRNGIAAALKFFKPKTVRPKKGRASYQRKTRYPAAAE
jgi:stalled ribosome alternative rescue factor ArfA